MSAYWKELDLKPLSKSLSLGSPSAIHTNNSFELRCTGKDFDYIYKLCQCEKCGVLEWQPFEVLTLTKKGERYSAKSLFKRETAITLLFLVMFLIVLIAMILLNL